MFCRITLAIVLVASATAAAAQEPEITVTAASASVHKGPSTGSPVIGKVPQGTVLEVTRHLGDWVKVAWTEAPDSTGYVHLSAGTLGARGASGRRGTPARGRDTQARVHGPSSTSRPAPPAPRPGELAGRTRTAVLHAEPVVHDHEVPDAVYITPPSHRVGLGGQVSGSALGFGAGARVWSRRKLGVQVDFSRFALTSQLAPGRVTSFQFAPGVLYALPDRVSDYFWLRPYLGAGLGIQRHRFSDAAAAGVAVSESRVGFHAFGGGEITFASLPRFALSTDVAYRWREETPFAGFELGRMAFSISGRFYIR